MVVLLIMSHTSANKTLLSKNPFFSGRTHNNVSLVVLCLIHSFTLHYIILDSMN